MNMAIGVYVSPLRKFALAVLDPLKFPTPREKAMNCLSSADTQVLRAT